MGWRVGDRKYFFYLILGESVRPATLYLQLTGWRVVWFTLNWPVNRVGPGEKVRKRENSGERKGADMLPCFPPALPSLSCLFFSPLLPYWTLETRELFD